MPDLIKIQLANIKSFGGNLKGRINVIFWLLLGILLLLEGLQLKSSLDFVLTTQKEEVAPVKSKGVRINFSDYDENIQRIEKAKNYIPSPEAWADPFTGKRNIQSAAPVVEEAVQVDESPGAQASSTPEN